MQTQAEIISGKRSYSGLSVLQESPFCPAIISAIDPSGELGVLSYHPIPIGSTIYDYGT